jgi:hypothetical protein
MLPKNPKKFVKDDWDLLAKFSASKWDGEQTILLASSNFKRANGMKSKLFCLLHTLVSTPVA